MEHPEAGRDDRSYTDRGRGRPVVLLHGGVANRELWEPTIDLLSRTHRATWGSCTLGRRKGLCASDRTLDCGTRVRLVGAASSGQGLRGAHARISPLFNAR